MTYRAVAKDFDRMLDGFFGRSYGFENRTPAVNVVENEESFIIEAELPGFSEEDINVSVENDRLSISTEAAKAEEKEGDSYLIRERMVRNFSRTFKLPRHVDQENISAVYKNGILTLTIAKSEKAKPKQIAISAA